MKRNGLGMGETWEKYSALAARDHGDTSKILPRLCASESKFKFICGQIPSRKPPPLLALFSKLSTLFECAQADSGCPDKLEPPIRTIFKKIEGRLDKIGPEVSRQKSDFRDLA